MQSRLTFEAENTALRERVAGLEKLLERVEKDTTWSAFSEPPQLYIDIRSALSPSAQRGEAP